MIAALVLFGMGNQTGSEPAVYASAAVTVYALMVPGAAWRLALSPATWRLTASIGVRIGIFFVAAFGAALLAGCGPVLGPLGSLALIAVLGTAGAVAAVSAWRMVSLTWRKGRAFAGKRSHVVDHWVMLVRLSLG
jgi:hypothetical protein